MKTVSVVMCTYNGDRYLRQQLDSIVGQTYPIHELIIQDDGSTDGTADIARAYAEQYPFIKFYKNEHNLGFNENFKSAVMKATGDFIALSDQDDVWFPEKIETQVHAIGNHSICCSYHLFGPDMATAPIVERECSAEKMLFYGLVGHTMLCQRAFIQNEHNWIAHIWYDRGLTINGYLADGITIVRQPLNWHRLHEQEASYEVPTKKVKPFIPYLLGYRCYHERQQTSTWNIIYTYIYENTSDKLSLTHQMSGLLLKKDLLSFLHLCYLCLKHRDKIYPDKTIGKGVMYYVRAFCYPLFWSYTNNDLFRYFK